MAEAKFDPYHAWLGIPAWDRPVNAYRLLGVEVFEQNRKVIEAAANRQMAYLQELSSGDEHIEEAQKMLGQVSKARVVLLNPEKKAAYDKKLIAQLDSLPEATGDGSQSTKIPTHSSAAVTLAKKEKGLNRLSVIRVTLLGLAGLLVIVCVLLFRSKNLVVRTYTDKNRNQRFDEGEEAANVGVVKFFIDPKKLGGGELDQFSWPTNDSGIVKLENIKAGPIGFTTEPPYEVIQPPDPDDPDKVSADDEKLFYEALVENGPRFFAQVVDIPVIQIENAAQSSAEEKQLSQAVQGEVVDNKQQQREPEKSFGSKTSEFELSGQITTANPESEPQVLNRPWFIDTDGNGVWKRGKERSIVPDDQGRFEVVVSIGAIRDDTKFRVIPQGFDDQIQDPGGISLSLEDIKEGVLEIAVELERKSISYQGNVQMEPAEESPEGFVVYVDKNQNAQRDEGETHIKTNAEGNFQIEEEWFEDYQKPTILRVEPDPEKYEMPVPTGLGRQNIKLPSITFKDANFKIAKKKIAINPDPIAEVELGPTPENDPASFLRGLGFSGDLPEEGSDEKPVWAFQINDDLASQFTMAKRAYDKAAKKGKWRVLIPELELAKTGYNRQIETIMEGAGNSETARKAAFDQTKPYNEEIKKIDEKLVPIIKERERLSHDVVIAAQAIEQQQQQYQAALDDTGEERETAANNLGISIKPLQALTKKQAAWQPALQFLAERKLVKMGLQKQSSRKWAPTGIAQEAAMLAQITQFARQNFQDYYDKKKEILELIRLGNPAAYKTRIDNLQRQVTNQTKYAPYKNAKKEFDRMTKIYLEHLDTLQKQRAEIEGNKEAIENILGGAKKYQSVLKQFPTDKQMDDKQEFIIKLIDYAT